MRRRTLLPWLAIGTAGIGLSGCQNEAPAESADHPLQANGVTPLGKAWAASSINVSVFRENAILADGAGGTLVSLFDDAGHLQVLHLGADGSIGQRLAVLPHLSERLLSDGHCSASMALDPAGDLHLLYGAHDTQPWAVRIPASAWRSGPAVQTFTASAWPVRMSYPQLYNLPDRLELWFRADPASQIHRQAWLQAEGRWQDSSEPVLLPGAAEWVYMNQIALSARQMALSWMYRLPSQDDKVRNEGMWLVQSTDGGLTWATPTGAGQPLPIGRGDIGPLFSLPDNLQPLNQTGTGFGPDGRLYLTWYAMDAQGVHQIMLTTLDPQGRIERSEAVSRSTSRFDLLGRGTLTLPLSRPQVLASARHVHVVYRQEQSMVIASRAVNAARDAGASAWSFLKPAVAELGVWEPCVSRQHWQASGSLVLYVQPAFQGAQDTSSGQNARDAALWTFRERA